MGIIDLINKMKMEFNAVSEKDILYILSDRFNVPIQELKFFSNINLTEPDISAISKQLIRRQQGEPLQYITAKAYFRDYELNVGEGVLIPRPETEVLVDYGVKVLQKKCNPFVLDIGTGSGAIAISFAVELHDASVFAVDISSDAIKYAEKNIAAYNLTERISLFRGNLFEPLSDDIKFDLIAANLPYVSDSFYDLLPDEVKNFEPHSALFAENEGLDIIIRCISEAGKYMNPKGRIILEISPEQSRNVKDLLRDAGFSTVEVIKDLTGRDRFCCGCLE